MSYYSQEESVLELTAIIPLMAPLMSWKTIIKLNIWRPPPDMYIMNPCRQPMLSLQAGLH
jgi:hypothetical protein